MNKIFKVIWNEARNAYVVVSEIAKNHGSKSCSTKKLLAMLIATGVMTCASFDVLAEKPAAEKTAAQQYVALKAKEFDTIPWPGTPDWKEYKAQRDGKKEIGGYTYRYDKTNKYWVREGYVLTVYENGGKYTQLSDNAIRADVAYTGTGVPEGILQSVTSTVSASGTVTNMGESLNKITAGSFAGVSHAGGTEVEGSWDYIIKDASWEGKVASSNYKDGYVNLCAGETATAPKGFVNTDSKDLIWDDSRQAYFYKNQRVDYSNMYVINGKLGVFTNADSTKVYTGTVYGKNNEILMTVKDKDNNFYSYWAAEVTDPSATMATYRVEEYNKNLAKLVENDDALNRNDIKEVTLTKGENSATIGLMRNGDKAVDGAITVTSGGGTGGKDTFVKISNAADTEGKNFATGSKVEAIVDNNGATTGIKINGEDYTIKSGSKVSVTQNADEKTTTITVDGKATTITDTDTTYTAGNGIAIDKTNKNAISVKLKEGENNLEVTEAGLALKQDLTVNSVKAGDTIVNTNGLTIGTGDKGIVLSTTNVSMGGQQIHNVAKGTNDNDAVNVSQLNKVSAAAKTEVVKGTNIDSVVASNATDDGHTVYTVNAKGTSVSVDGNFNLNTTTDDETNVTNYGISLKDSVTIGGTHAVTINGTDGTVTGLTNTTWNKDSITSGRAATEDQLQAVATEAGKHTTLSNGKNTTVKTVTTADGHLEYKVDVNDELKDIKSIIGAGEGAGSISFANDGIKFNNKVTINKDGKITGVAAGAITETSTDAVNGSQLHAVATEAGKHTTLSNGKNTTVKTVTTADGHLEYKVDVNDELKDIKSIIGAGKGAGSISFADGGIKLNNKVTINKDGKISGVAAGEVSSTSTDAINGSQLHAVKTELQTSDKHLVGNPASADGYYKPDAKGDISLRVEDQNKNGYDVVIKDVASKAELGDVAKRVTNVENKVTQIETDITTIKTDINNINTRVDNVEALAGKHTTLEKNGTNINVEETVVDGQKNYKVNLNKDITLGDENGNNVSISGTNGTITATGDITTANRINAANGGKLADIDVTGNKLSNGNSSITLDGTNVKVNDKVTVDKDGKISGVAKGDISNTSTDAVNGSQLYDTNTHITNVENQVISNSNRINQLGNRVNKVGAGAAALAALHPMDFDPDDKLTFSAGYGNYAGENAAAIGAYYRPDEKVMFSVAGTVGNGENMVNAGVSFALDRTNHVSNSRTALAREVIDLRGQLAVMGAKMAKMEKALGMLDETKTKLFPDIPANHWAYEYIAKLAGNGYIEGYPDGNFGGDRLMTRYEFAAMLYRAIENGAALEEKIIKEFEPELGRIRVDRISGEDGDRDKIERVRVNDTKGERDHYGNKLAK